MGESLVSDSVKKRDGQVLETMESIGVSVTSLGLHPVASKGAAERLIERFSSQEYI
jgi:hypothetical protein